MSTSDEERWVESRDAPFVADSDLSTPTAASVLASDKPLTATEVAQRSLGSIVIVKAGERLGTGFACGSEGFVVTNAHVVAGETEIVVRTAGGRKFPVLDVRGLDTSGDLVVLRTNARGLPRLALNPANTVRPGDPVVVIGHPLGLEATVSTGVVAALRQTDGEIDLLQITAPIAPGSSGGPILDRHGTVIAVSTFLARGGQNIGFGVRVRRLRRLLGRRFVLGLEEFAEHTREKRADTQTLAGCSVNDLEKLSEELVETLKAAAGLEARASSRLFEGAAEDIPKALSERCVGPREMLANARTAAMDLDEPDERATNLRASFEALLELARKAKTGR